MTMYAILARAVQTVTIASAVLTAVACASPTEEGDDLAADGDATSVGDDHIDGSSTGSGGPLYCAVDADCDDGDACTADACLGGGVGEFTNGTCSNVAQQGDGCVPPADDCLPGDEDCDRGDGDGGGDDGACGQVCTGGQLDPSSPYDLILTQSNSTISTGGNGSRRIKVVGDDNVITTDGGGTCIFDVYGSNNQIYGTYSGGGSIVTNVLSGTDNSVDFGTVGGCNAVNFSQGTLHVTISGCGASGNAINGAPAENKTYTLP
jgi:hypothetical protein